MPKKRYFVLVPHCLLNPATRVHVLGHGFNLTQQIMDYMLSKNIGIIQLPCPEFTSMGYWRNPQGRQQYDNIFFNKHCKKELEPFIDMIIEMTQNNHTLLCYLGIAGSPTCSVFWGKHKLNRHHTESIHPCEGGLDSLTNSQYGVMTQILNDMLSSHEISIPLLEVPIKENIHTDKVKDFFASLDGLLGISEEFRTEYIKVATSLE
ncbi:MAG: hypothetical protein ACRCST_04840 [Turicibacter sp.]